MLSSLSSALKPRGSAGGLYSISRRSSGWANYGRGKYRRLPPRISAQVVVVGVAGTVLAYKLTSAAFSLDYDTMKNNFSELIGQRYKPTAACMGCTGTVKTTELSDEDKEKAAKGILTNSCGITVEEEVNKIIAEMFDYLKQKKEATETEEHLINDAIHGSIPLSPLFYQIINTPEFHRLKDIKQLGAGHYVYPGATHTRFEHSIGVCYVAGKFARSLKQKLKTDKEKLINNSKGEYKDRYEFTDEEVLCAELAGLCHDLGHGPLSHMFEKVIKEVLKIKEWKKVEHEDLSVEIFKRMLAKNPKVLAEFVSNGLEEEHVELVGHMIKPPELDSKKRKQPNKAFLYEIVANKLSGIDVDKWDYYQRDCQYLGVLQDFQWRRTLRLGRIVMDPETKRLHIGFREKEMGNLYGMFRTRANIHQKACQHKTMKAIEKMIMDAMEIVKDLKLVWVVSETDQGEGEFKSIKEAVECAARGELSGYLAMRDSIVDRIMSADAGRETEEAKKRLTKAKDLLKRIEERNLYTCMAKKKVPIFIRLHEFLGSDHLSYKKHSQDFYTKAVTESSDVKAARKLCDDDHHGAERKKFEGMVYESLPHADSKSKIEEEDIWVEVVKIKHISEKNENPVDEVRFFEKPKSPKDLPEVVPKVLAKKRASMLVLPQAFVEYELRIYDKRSKDKREKSDQVALEEAMNKAWAEYTAKLN